jgi:predicted transcriptional regulator
MLDVLYSLCMNTCGKKPGSITSNFPLKKQGMSRQSRHLVSHTYTKAFEHAKYALTAENEWYKYRSFMV